MRSKMIFLVLLLCLVYYNSILSAEEIELSKETKKVLIDSISSKLMETYVFPKEAKKMCKLIKKNLSRKYDSIMDPMKLSRIITEDLRSVYKDGHLEIFPMRPAMQEKNISEKEMELERINQMRSKNFGFNRIEILAGNVGYLKLDNFEDVRFAGETAESAMKFIQNTDALIIDLRENGGGNANMIQFLSSYFFEEAKHLNSFYVKESDDTMQYWTQSFVPGNKYTGQPIYILTSGFTYSAAEEFSYNLKNLERATIVGETTGGGAHPVKFYSMPELGFILKIPFGKAVNPITKSNWEQIGVKPDIEITSILAKEKGYSAAIENLFKNCTDPIQNARLKWVKQGLDAKLNPITLSDIQLLDFVGQFGPRIIKVENESLFYARDKQPLRKLLPLQENWFMVETIDYFRIEFIRDESGKVNAIKGHYDSGREDLTPRSK